VAHLDSEASDSHPDASAESHRRWQFGGRRLQSLVPDRRAAVDPACFEAYILDTSARNGTLFAKGRISVVDNGPVAYKAETRNHGRPTVPPQDPAFREVTKIAIFDLDLVLQMFCTRYAATQ